MRGQKGDKDYRSATRDVARLLVDMKAQKVDSLLVDLRNNGGGSLREAVELTGLFVGKVPVVQARNAKGGIAVERNVNVGHGLGRSAGRADQPGVGVGIGDLCGGDPGLRPRPDHRRAQFRQGHGADRGQPRPDRPQCQAGVWRAENDHCAVLPGQRWHDPVARRDAGHRLSKFGGCCRLWRIEFRQCLALDPHQGGRLHAGRRRRKPSCPPCRPCTKRACGATRTSRTCRRISHGRRSCARAT